MSFESGTGKDRLMVFPCRITEPDIRSREVAVQEIRTDLQCTVLRGKTGL